MGREVLREDGADIPLVSLIKWENTFPPGLPFFADTMVATSMPKGGYPPNQAGERLKGGNKDRKNPANLP